MTDLSETARLARRLERLEHTYHKVEHATKGLRTAIKSLKRTLEQKDPPNVPLPRRRPEPPRPDAPAIAAEGEGGEFIGPRRRGRPSTRAALTEGEISEAKRMARRLGASGPLSRAKVEAEVAALRHGDPAFLPSATTQQLFVSAVLGGAESPRTFGPALVPPGVALR